MATRVLILNKQLVFAVTLKQALEQTGAFEVHPFTTAQAALEYLREHPQDVALVDFTLPGVTGTQLVQWLRATQSDLAIVASPRPADADAIIAGLGIQGMVSQPFTARDIIPLLQKAVDAVQQAGNDPTRAKTDQLPASRPVEGAPPPPRDPQYGKTRILDDDPPAPPRDLQYGKTRALDDGPSNVPPPRPVGKTRILDDVEQPKPTPPYDPAYGRTRKLDEPPPPPPPLASPNYQTRNLEEPPVEEGDTPPVPTRDSEAMRQFLVTSGKPAIDSLFDDVLDVIDAEIASVGDEAEESEETGGDPFKGMIKSLSRDEQTSRLPERQPSGTDFTYTSGMDAVLREIARTKTGTLPAVPPEVPRDPAESTFQKLAQEEPPMPALEDSGTVGDLMVGVTDHQFRNVLALLRGEDAYPSSTEAERAAIEEAFAGVFWPGGEDVEPPPTLPEEAALTSPKAGEAAKDDFREEFDRLEYAESFDDEAGDATVAQLILETALDESTPPGEFSINRLIDDIDARLSIHKLAIRGLPSWGQDTGAFRPVDAEGIREPDFLPADLPPGEMIVPELPQFESEDIDEGMFTTQPSTATREALESQGEQSSATIEIPDDWYSGETVASQSVGLPDAAHEHPVTVESDAIEDTSHLTDTSQWDEVTPVSGSLPVDVDMPEEVSALVDEEPVEPVWLDDAEFIAGETDTVFDGYGRFDDVPEYEDGYNAEESAPETEPPPQAAPSPVYDENAWLKPLLQKPGESPEPEEPVPAVESEASEPPLTVWNEPEPDDSGVATRPLDIVPELADHGIVSSWDVQAHDEGGSITQPLTSVDSWTDERETSAESTLAERPDTDVAQVALSLTQASLELSAEATLLTEDGEIVAFAGHLSPEDVNELREAIENDWEARPEGARMRFVTLPSSGTDYMLYSILTESGLTLSMVFNGSTPLRVIRKQGHLLADALQSVPEVPPPPPAPPVVEKAVVAPPVPAKALVQVAALSSHSYVWLLRDPDEHLSDAVAQAIISGLRLQLEEQGWQVILLQVHEDFVYLLAEVPGETPPHLLMRDLKRRSAEIAHVQDARLDPKTLWADSYLILMPGRELETEEILEFVNFQRML